MKNLLIEQARTSAKLLRETKPPQTRRRSAHAVNVEEEAALLDEAASAVEAAVALVKKEELEAQKTLRAREQADEAWATSFTCAGDLLAIVATVAGVEGVAERVKTNWRRRSGIADTKRVRRAVDPTEDPTEDPNEDPTDEELYGPNGPFIRPTKE